MIITKYWKDQFSICPRSKYLQIFVQWKVYETHSSVDGAQRFASDSVQSECAAWMTSFCFHFICRVHKTHQRANIHVCIGSGLSNMYKYTLYTFLFVSLFVHVTRKEKKVETGGRCTSHNRCWLKRIKCISTCLFWFHRFVRKQNYMLVQNDDTESTQCLNVLNSTLVDTPVNMAQSFKQKQQMCVQYQMCLRRMKARHTYFSNIRFLLISKAEQLIEFEFNYPFM